MLSFLFRSLDILYPRHCPLCDGFLKMKEQYLCSDCIRKIQFIKPPVCGICGRPAALLGDRYSCESCHKDHHYFKQNISPFVYEGIYKESLMKFKYHGRAEYASFYAATIYSFGGEKIEEFDPEAIIPVPAHKSRERKRGYNQAYLIAKELSKYLNVPVDKHLVKRSKKTKPLKELTETERKEELRSAFKICGGKCRYKKVLIVDDILTTGATLDSVAFLLKGSGAKEVHSACVCVTHGKDDIVLNLHL